MPTNENDVGQKEVECDHQFGTTWKNGSKSLSITAVALSVSSTLCLCITVDIWVILML